MFLSYKPTHTGKLKATFGYAGMMEHQPSGLNLTLYRGYDAKAGRWLSEDPIGFNGGVNLYGYVGGNVVNLFDELGLYTTIYTDMTKNRTVLIHNGEIIRDIPTSNKVTKNSKPGADDPYDGFFTKCDEGALGRSYGTRKLRTTDKRYRWVHSGGPRKNPYAPRQGWAPTFGCTRAQTEDLEGFCDAIKDILRENPKEKIIYRRDRPNYISQ